MKSISKGSISTALRTVRTNRARSFMTMLGIIIGVFAAVVVVGIGEGVQNQVQSQVAKLGKDLITIRPASGSAGGIFGSFGDVSPTSTLTVRDVKAAQSSSQVSSITPLAIVDGNVTLGGGGHFDGTVIGTTSNFASVLHQGISYGGFLTDDPDQSQMAVIGANVANNVFGESVPLGRAFTLRGQNFIVVGVLNPFDTVPLSSQVDFNNAIFIPYQTAQQLTNNSALIYEILARPKSTASVDSAVSSLTQKLAAVHGGQNSFAVLKQGQSLRVTNSILGQMSALVLVAAATALFIGGIGIMNIMLVSITERMREIGIRKAVGATNRQIMAQFLTEALLLSLFGWLLGVLVSIGAIYLIRLFTTLEPIVPWDMVGISFVVTLVAGVLFGSIPALKAAMKDPIDALRNE